MRRYRPTADATCDLTSMIDIAFLLIIFFLALPMRRLDFKLESFLPKGLGPRPSIATPEDPIHIRVRRTGDALTFAVGDRAAATPGELRPTLRKLGAERPYEIDATPNVPWKGVVGVVDVLKEIGCTEVRFRGGPPPGPGIRRARR
jgi:biopolymer transport protein ExbD